MFCVVCGKETPDEELRHGECVSCYVEKNVLASLRENVDIEVCVHCHARRRGEIWIEGHGSLEPIVDDVVREAIDYAKVVEKPRTRMTITAEDERNFSVHVVASGTAEGVPFEKELKTRSRIKNATCVRCSRVQGGYYEAVVQVRATKRLMPADEMRAIKGLASRFINRVVQDGDRNAFVLKDEETDRGLDIYMGTTNSGRMLAKLIALEYGGHTSDHPKTVGRKDGLDLIRLTFAVKLPEYRANDIIVMSDEIFTISSIGQKTVQLIELHTGRLRHVERILVERAHILSPEDSREAVVVSSDDKELQLLDPWSYETVSVIRPKDLVDLGSTVDVLKHDGELIVIKKVKQ